MWFKYLLANPFVNIYPFRHGTVINCLYLRSILIKKMKGRLFLFDLDGVIIDTEGQYSLFWNEIGERYKGDREFAMKIKGQTLSQIFAGNFPDMPELCKELVKKIDLLERNLSYDYIPGVMEFIEDVKMAGIPSAIVTSSNREKMKSLYLVRPELKSLFDRIYTGEDFARSKPAPDCYLNAMREFGVAAERTVIFEDSPNGLKAACDSGGNVVGVATTFPRDEIAPFCSIVIDNFKEVTVERLCKELPK